MSEIENPQPIPRSMGDKTSAPPRVPRPLRAAVDPLTRAEVIDQVDRMNHMFDDWDSAALLDAFSDDVLVEHPLGRSQGRDELFAFLQAYEPITHGVRRHNCNHIVDGGPGEDVTVTYYILLIRIAPSSEAELLKTQPMRMMEYEEHLPKLISYAKVTDVLRRVGPGEWQVRHKHVRNVAEDRVFHF